MTTVAPKDDGVLLPAFDGRDPLDFLAAVGVLRLLSMTSDTDVRLSWDPAGARPRLSGTGSLEAIAASLASAFNGTTTSAPVPGLPAVFHVPTKGNAAAVTDLTRAQYRAAIARATHAADGDPAWFSSLITDLWVRRKKAKTKGDPADDVCERTPYVRINQNSSVLKELANAHVSGVSGAHRSSMDGFLTALRSRARVPGELSNYLDNRASNSAAEAMGEDQYFGRPRLAWLAYCSLPLLRLGGTTGLRCAGWQPVDGSAELRWPLWTPRLDVDAVLVLLDHPSVARAPLDWPRLQALGVWLVGAAEYRGTKADNRIKALATTRHERPGNSRGPRPRPPRAGDT